MSNNVKIFDINYFSYLDKPAVYASKGYFALSPIDVFPDFQGQVRVNSLLMLFCLEGTIHVTLHEQPLELSSGMCLMVPPNSLVSHVIASKDCVSTLIGYSLEIVSKMLAGSQKAWELFAQLTQKPLIYNDQRYLQDRLKTFLNILRYRTRNNDQYLEELSYHLFAALFFDIINDIHVPHATHPTADSTAKNRYRAGFIYKKFLLLVSEDDGEHRSVAYYADKLYISPKYLSKIVKSYTGKPAQRIILEHVVERIKVELKYTEHPMKRISEQFHFENYPSFCKFVKTHLGVTAQEYRSGEKPKVGPFSR